MFSPRSPRGLLLVLCTPPHVPHLHYSTSPSAHLSFNFHIFSIFLHTYSLHTCLCVPILPHFEYLCMSMYSVRQFGFSCYSGPLGHLWLPCHLGPCAISDPRVILGFHAILGLCAISDSWVFHAILGLCAISYIRAISG